MQILIDTNVWISGLLWGGYPKRIINLVEQQKIVLLMSDRLLRELAKILAYTKLQRRLKTVGKNPEDLLLRVQQLAELHPDPIALPDTIPNLRDPDDAIVLATAAAAKVEAIISGDRDLLTLIEYKGIPILTPRAFLDRHFPDRADRT